GMSAEEDLLQVRQGGPESADEKDPDEQTAEPGDEADDDVDSSQPLRADESRRAHHGDEGVRHKESEDEREKDHDPGDARDSGDAGEEQGLRAGLGADAVDHPDAEPRLLAVLRRGDRGRVLVAVDARLQRAPAVANEIENEHPAAAEAELALAAQVLIDGEEHQSAEQHERHTDD